MLKCYRCKKEIAKVQPENRLGRSSRKESESNPATTQIFVNKEKTHIKIFTLIKQAKNVDYFSRNREEGFLSSHFGFRNISEYVLLNWDTKYLNNLQKVPKI